MTLSGVNFDVYVSAYGDTPEEIQAQKQLIGQLARDGLADDASMSQRPENVRIALTKEQLTEDAAKKQAIQRLYAYEEKLIEKGVQISENNVKIEINHQDCVSRGTLTVIERTGREAPTEKKTQPKERTPEDG